MYGFGFFPQQLKIELLDCNVTMTAKGVNQSGNRESKVGSSSSSSVYVIQTISRPYLTGRRIYYTKFSSSGTIEERRR